MRRALCIGIDQYMSAPLHGCVNDAKRMVAVLERHQDDSPNFECRSMTAPSGSTMDVVTRAAVRQQLRQLLSEPADIALLHFSGHGTANNLDGYLVTQDASRFDEGVSMTEVLSLANNSKVAEIVILLDCCFAGSFGNVPAVDNTKAFLREGISILTASRGDQPSVEAGGGGVFTSLVVDALEGGAADLLGSVTAPAIYAYVEAALGAWEQRPLFKAHVTRVLPLRNCIPPIERSILRDLPALFPLPAEDKPLNPAFEPTSPAPDEAKLGVFQKLQALNRVHLVTPVDAPHMYDAAMKSRSCRLTRSGRYYWRLAKDGRI